MREKLRIPLGRIPAEGLEVEAEVETDELELEDSWPPLSGVRVLGRVERTGPGEAVFRGRVRGTFRLTCSLGLAEFGFKVDEPLTAYFQSSSKGVWEAEVELEEKDLEVSFVREDAIDLVPVLRDQLGLAIPLQPKCPGGCLGENPELCRRLEAGEGVGGEGEPDPRWAALRGWNK